MYIYIYVYIYILEFLEFFILLNKSSRYVLHCLKSPIIPYYILHRLLNPHSGYVKTGVDKLRPMPTWRCHASKTSDTRAIFRA